LFKEITILQYRESGEKVPLIDVRSPKEFEHAHIPGAINIPLFSNEERAIVGITYKNEGQDSAIKKGLELVGPKMADFVALAKQIASDVQADSLVVHCWRGGMRSKSLATLFNFAGINTNVIKGGYKSYRRLMHATFAKPWPLIIIGGKTGSAKTAILQALENAGEQIIDLEKMANHKGSAFGHIGEAKQPGTEMFENLLFEALSELDISKRIWIEDESHLIGTVFIPELFWEHMRNASVLHCEFPTTERINYLVKTYGGFEKQALLDAVKRIAKRLGGQHAQAAIDFFEAGNLAEATATVLIYYDKTYSYGLSQRPQEKVSTLTMDTIDPNENAKTIIKHANELLQLQIVSIDSSN